jgi:hypothetical protein
MSMSEANPDLAYWLRDIKAPQDPLGKFKLLWLLDFNDRAKRRHRLVYGFILDWWHAGYGDALASVRHVRDTLKARDPHGRGISISLISEALRELVKWGYLIEVAGKGRNANRYIPDWGRLAEAAGSVHPVLNASGNAACVHPALNTDVHPALNTNADSVHAVPNKDPLTGPGYDPGQQVSRLASPAPLQAPPADGLEATAAEAGEGFERLYRVYGVFANKAAARAAFEKLNPPPATVIDAARRWKAAAGDIDRIQLKRWIEEERYDEEPSSKGARAGKAALPKPKQGTVRRDATVESVVINERGYGELSCLWNDCEPGEKPEHTRRLHPDGLRDIEKDLAIPSVADLVGRRVFIDFHKDDSETWYRYPDAFNDNLGADEAA